MRYLAVFLCVACLSWAKDIKQVQVVATHSVTREDSGARALADAAIVGPGRPRTMSESYNLDAIIDGEHVLLACDDSKGCEAPVIGTYQANLKRGRWLSMSFNLPVSNKQVTRWYKIAGSW